MIQKVFRFTAVSMMILILVAVAGYLFPASGEEICIDGVCTFDPGGDGDSVTLDVKTRGLVISKVPFSLTVTAMDPDGNPVEDLTGAVTITPDQGEIFMQDDQSQLEPFKEAEGFASGVMTIEGLVIAKPGANILTVTVGDAVHRFPVRVIPGFLTILPPLLAIILALALRQVVVSLFLGVWLGSAIVYGFNPFQSFLRVADTYLINALADADHISIIVFSLFLGGMVAIISRSGGSQGMVDVIRKYAKNPRSGQIATWAMGLFIFFDDYANTLIVGNSMRPLTDRLKISREKLSFLVDATAAPVTNIAVISTWIGFEIGVLGDSLKTAGLDKEPYLMFIETIPYRFYPILLLVFVFLVGYLSRDFGPMLKAEIRARSKGKVLAPGAKPLSSIGMSPVGGDDPQVPRRWYNAVVPIVSVIVFTIAGLWYSGALGLLESGGREALQNAKIYQFLDNANSFHVLLWASLGGSIVAAGMVISQGILKLEETVSTWIDGAKSLMPAIVILALAWSIGDICRELQTGSYIALLTRGTIAPQLLPAIIFVLSAAIAFATGTSWGTMSIVMPIAIHLGVHLPPESMPEALRYSILLGAASGVLAGATFGDHCSPISDTTIMSSMASGADHVDHVRTQMPYALTVGVIGTLLGTIPAGYGMNPWIGMVAGVVAIYLVLRYYGRNPSQAAGVMVPSLADYAPAPDMDEESTGTGSKSLNDKNDKSPLESKNGGE